MSQQEKHTPGPWVTSKAPGGYGSPRVVAVEGDRIQASIAGRGVKLTEADARLIAAAPELLIELRNIADADPSTWGDDMRDQFQSWAQSRARAAIAKAEGR